MGETDSEIVSEVLVEDTPIYDEVLHALGLAEFDLDHELREHGTAYVGADNDQDSEAVAVAS